MIVSILCGLYILFTVLFLCFSQKETSGRISLTTTYTVRGLLIIFIILHHIAQRIDNTSFITIPFLYFVYLFVGLFFFLSGYGNAISIFKVDTGAFKWLLKRLATLFFYYFIGLILNVLLNHNLYIDISKSFLTCVFNDLINLKYSPHILWFFKIIIFCYIFTYFLYLVDKKIIQNSKYMKGNEGIVLLFICIVYITICFVIKVPGFWWNSVIAYPFGFLYAQEKKSITLKLPSIISVFLIFLITSVFGLKIQIFKPIAVVSFCLIFILYISNFSLRSFLPLQLIGKVSLGIYLYHTVLLSSFSTVINDWYAPLLIIFCSIIIALCVFYFFQFLFRRKKIK